jgi:ribonuclease HII
VRRKSKCRLLPWNHDRRLTHDFPGGLVGVDEVGRGCLAGPVVAAAFWVSPDYLNRGVPTWARPLTDSKQLSAPRRAVLHQRLQQERSARRLDYALGLADTAEIDDLNILGATRLAMERAIRRLLARHPEWILGSEADNPQAPLLPLFDLLKERGAAVGLLIDGRPLKPFPWPHQALVKGDSRSFVIAAASIVAKQVRDRLMALLDQQYPGYGWKENKGYGTAVHCEALRRLGPNPQHRSSFLHGLVLNPDEATKPLNFS